MFIDAGANAISGMVTFSSSMVGGILGVKVPGIKSSYGDMSAFLFLSTVSGIYPMKIILAILKKILKEKN